MKRISVITSLFNCLDYIESYLDHVLKVENFDEVEFLLLHNQPKPQEIAIIEKYSSQYKNIRYIIIPEREGLYATWNRGIKLATGEYLTVWNVDDIRTPDSILNQAKALDKNTNAMLAYGDFYGVDTYGTEICRSYTYPAWPNKRAEFFRRHMIGCFPMWRKMVHDTIGFFDENYRLVADYEFQLRLALNYNLVKAEGALGYYLENQPHKLSSQQNTQHIERTSVELRYAIYGSLDLSLREEAIAAYDVENVINFGKKYPVRQLIHHYDNYLKRKSYGYAKSYIHTFKQSIKRGIKELLGVSQMRELPVYRYLTRLN
ncbi:glycosyltransferase [Spirosoma koreense]